MLKGQTKHFEYREKIRPDTPYSQEEMLQIGGKIEQEDDAHKLFQGMKDAWRQERSRHKKKETGHLACLFVLNGDTKGNLKEMAKEQGTDATALLEKLIAKAYKAHQFKQKKKQKSTLFDGRSDPFVLLEPPTQSRLKDNDESPAPGQDHPAANQSDIGLLNDPRGNAGDSFNEDQVLALPAALAPDERVPMDDLCSEPIDSPNPSQAAHEMAAIGRIPPKKKRAVPDSLMMKIRSTNQAASELLDTIDLAKEINEPKSEPSK